MKQQDALRCSSSRRESSPAPENLHAKRIGCLSGIFRLLSKSHNRRRSITFGKKQEKNSNVGTEHCSQVVSSPKKTQEETKANRNDSRRFSCDAVLPRSPTLPAGIRRGLSSPSPAENFQTPQSVVVTRLMGLEDHAAAVAEKRRSLLGALEKCDEDLKALKKMIEVVKSNSITTAGDQKGGDRIPCAAAEKGHSEQCPAVSVLDEFARSALSGFSKRCSNIGWVSQQQKKIKPGEEESIAILDRITAEIIQEKTQRVASTTTTSLWTSKAMIESVNEVCRDISWGERREVGRIGLALQDCICRDLIDEIVKEMGYVDRDYSLPFESCKRKLIF